MPDHFTARYNGKKPSSQGRFEPVTSHLSVSYPSSVKCTSYLPRCSKVQAHHPLDQSYSESVVLPVILSVLPIILVNLLLAGPLKEVSFAGKSQHSNSNFFFFFFFSILSLFPPAFLPLVFQPLISAQTGFTIGARQPSGLDY